MAQTTTITKAKRLKTTTKAVLIEWFCVELKATVKAWFPLSLIQVEHTNIYVSTNVYERKVAEIVSKL